MKRKYYQVIINETSRNYLSDKLCLFNDIQENFKSIDEVKEYLKSRYGKIPKGKNKIYRDSKNGEPIVVGFLYSYWNKDWSHMTKSWYQTDWIEISEISENINYINLN